METEFSNKKLCLKNNSNKIKDWLEERKENSERGEMSIQTELILPKNSFGPTDQSSDNLDGKSLETYYFLEFQSQLSLKI